MKIPMIEKNRIKAAYREYIDLHRTLDPILHDIRDNFVDDEQFFYLYSRKLCLEEDIRRIEKDFECYMKAYGFEFLTFFASICHE